MTMIKLLHEFLTPSGGMAVKMPESPERDSPELTFRTPRGVDLDLPQSGTATIEFELVRVDKNVEQGDCRYTVRILQMSKPKVEKRPYKVKSTAEAMREALDKDEDED